MDALVRLCWSAVIGTALIGTATMIAHYDCLWTNGFMDLSDWQLKLTTQMWNK